MGSRMETLPASAPPTSTSELSPLSPTLCSSSALVGSSLKNCHIKERHGHSSMYSSLPTSMNLRSHCKPGLSHHYFGASSHTLQYSCFHQLVNESNLYSVWSVEKGKNGSQNGQRVSAELNSYLAGIRQLRASLPAVSGGHFLPVYGAAVVHRLPVAPFPSLLVHSLVKSSPFVLEVTSESEIKKPNCANEPSASSSTSNSSPLFQLNTKESAGISGDQVPFQSGIRECESSPPLPCDSLLGRCSRTTVSISEDQSGNIADTNGPRNVGTNCWAELTTFQDVSSTTSITAGPDDLEDDTDDDDDDDDDEDNNITIPYESDEDQKESDYEYSHECEPQKAGGSKLTAATLTSLCTSLSVPSKSSPLKKLLSDESGYYEGLCCEEGDKADSSWWQSVTGDEDEEEDEEVDWDSDDSGGEDIDEELLQSFKDFALSPQVLSVSPRPPVKSTACVASDSASASSPRSTKSPVYSCSLSTKCNGLITTIASSACCRCEHRKTPEQSSPLNSRDNTTKCADVNTHSTPSHLTNVSTHSTPSHLKSVSTRRGSSSSLSKRIGQHTKHVHFAEDAEVTSVHTICVWTFACRAARKGPWEQFARDRAHFRRRIETVALVLEPCLTARRAAMAELVPNSVKS